MQIKTEAIVFKTIRYSDADLIIKLFTKEKGLYTFIAKGLLKSKKGKIRSSFFQPLSLLEVDTSFKNNSSFSYLKEVKPIVHYETLHTKIIKTSIITFITEILNSVILENQSDYELFEFLKKTILWFDTSSETKLFHHLFLIKLTYYLGFYPNTTNSDFFDFSMENGNFELNKNSKNRITGKDALNFKKILGTNFDNLSEIKITKKERTQLLENILLYYKLHIEEFKNPKSLEILQELFN